LSVLGTTIESVLTAYSYGVANVNLHSYTPKKKSARIWNVSFLSGCGYWSNKNYTLGR